MCLVFDKDLTHLVLFVNKPENILFAEASCAASLRTAKAVVQEAGPSVSPALRKLAKKSEGHAETVFHTTVAEQGLALEVPLTELPIAGGQSVPVLLLSDWVKLILKLVSDELFRFGSFCLMTIFIDFSTFIFSSCGLPDCQGEQETCAPSLRLITTVWHLPSCSSFGTDSES